MNNIINSKVTLSKVTLSRLSRCTSVDEIDNGDRFLEREIGTFLQ